MASAGGGGGGRDWDWPLLAQPAGYDGRRARRGGPRLLDNSSLSGSMRNGHGLRPDPLLGSGLTGKRSDPTVDNGCCGDQMVAGLQVTWLDPLASFWCANRV